MKKLFLLLILSFFSTQGYAGSCPDGSEPVKSISADGTYFVYNCGGNDTSTKTNNSDTSSAVSADNTSSVWKDNGVSDNVAKQLSRVGVNSSANWTSDPNFTAFDHHRNLPKVSNRNSDVEQVFSDGFSHLVYVVAFNRFFTQECQLKRDYRPICLDSDRVVAKFTSIKKQILETLIKHPDAVFVISLKPGFEVMKICTDGLECSFWHESFEENKEVREAFKNLWGLISKVLKDVPDENLAFNLLNEPQFERMKAWNKREIWQQWATEIVDVIRGVSPKRTIIIEGIHKSLFARGNVVPADVLTPISRKNIVYAFHYYNEEWGKQDQADKLEGVSGLPLPSLSKLKSNMQQLVDYTKHYKVPVVLTEIGVNGSCDGNGPLQKDRATYSAVVYETLVPSSIGVTWWSLESHNNTPYQRISGDCYNDIHEKKLIPDKQLFKALRLTPILTTEVKQPAKAVVDALQIILDNEVKKEAEKEAEKKAKKHTLFDGRYSFTISRYNENDGSQRLGNGYIEINNGIMTVAKEGRTLDTGSIDLYDSFEGQIDKKGNIISWLKIPILFGDNSTYLVDLNGSIDTQLQGKWDHYFDVILKLGKKESVKIVETNELFATIEASDEFDLSAIKASDEFDGKYAFKLISNPPNITKHQIGSGYFEIKSGFITVATQDRVLTASSNKFVTNKYYNKFEGRIDANGEIKANFFFNPCANGSKCYVQEEGEYNIAINDDKNITLLGNIKTHKLTGEFTKGSGPDIVKIIFELEDRN